MTSHLFRSIWTANLSLFLMAEGSFLAHATEALPPGFTAVFNGKDLEGWWGAETEDPRKYIAMSAQEFKKKHDTSLDDIGKHWRVENGELINDGKGLYLTT